MIKWYVFEVVEGDRNRPEILELIDLITSPTAGRAEREANGRWPERDLMVQCTVSYRHDRDESKVRARHCLPVRYHNRKAN